MRRDSQPARRRNHTPTPDYGCGVDAIATVVDPTKRHHRMDEPNARQATTWYLQLLRR